MVTKPQLKQLDYNVFVRDTDYNAASLIQWSIFKNNEYSVHSKYFPDYHGPLFKGIEVGNYQLLKSFPGSGNAAALPSEISKLLGQKEKYIGAYPPIE